MGEVLIRSVFDMPVSVLNKINIIIADEKIKDRSYSRKRYLEDLIKDDLKKRKLL